MVFFLGGGRSSIVVERICRCHLTLKATQSTRSVFEVSSFFEYSSLVFLLFENMQVRRVGGDFDDLQKHAWKLEQPVLKSYRLNICQRIVRLVGVTDP